MTDLIDVHQSNGVLVTTSRNVAQVFGKEHYNVLKDIERTLSQLPEEQNSNLTSGLFISFVYLNTFYACFWFC